MKKILLLALTIILTSFITPEKTQWGIRVSKIGQRTYTVVAQIDPVHKLIILKKYFICFKPSVVKMGTYSVKGGETERFSIGSEGKYLPCYIDKLEIEQHIFLKRNLKGLIGKGYIVYDHIPLNIEEWIVITDTFYFEVKIP